MLIEKSIAPPLPTLRPTKPTLSATFPVYHDLEALLAEEDSSPTSSPPRPSRTPWGPAGYAYSDAATVSMMLARMGLQDNHCLQVGMSVDAMFIRSTAYLIQSSDGSVVILDWQTQPKRTAGSTVVRLSERRGAAPATQNRRIAAVRGLFEFAVITGVVAASPVPAPRRSSGLRARRGLLGHIPARHPRPGGRLVRQHRLLPESLELAEVEAFLTDLGTHRDRAMVLLMLLGGLRAAEVRGLLLAEVDVGRRQVRVVGKGGRERVVPVDRPFFTELAAYLRLERPADCATEQCFVVLRGPTAGQPLTEAGMRRIFRTHRARSGAARVRPHRLRHTYGTQLAAAESTCSCCGT